MEILSHRGYWKHQDERNTRVAFERSFDYGLGTETDLRDHNGEIVISHDIPTGSPLAFEELLRIMGGRNLTLALNIKSDGLSTRIAAILDKFNHTNYFVFDMSIPEIVRYIKSKMIVFTGLSDIQPHPILANQCQGIWLDCFNSDWYGPGIIDGLLDQGQRVCVVSADLHQRTTAIQWHIIKSVRNISSSNLLICTDHPTKAQEYFGET